MTHETFVVGLLLRNFVAQQVAQQSCTTKVWCVISLTKHPADKHTYSTHTHTPTKKQ